MQGTPFLSEIKGGSLRQPVLVLLRNDLALGAGPLAVAGMELPWEISSEPIVPSWESRTADRPCAEAIPPMTVLKLQVLDHPQSVE